MEKLKELLDAVGRVPENAWGFGVLLIGSALAIVAHNTNDTNLFAFAIGLSGTGAAIMHAKKD